MKLETAFAFLKRWSRVRITPGTPLFSMDLSDKRTPSSTPDTPVLGVSRTNQVRGRDHCVRLVPKKAVKR